MLVTVTIEAGEELCGANSSPNHTAPTSSTNIDLSTLSEEQRNALKEALGVTKMESTLNNITNFLSKI